MLGAIIEKGAMTIAAMPPAVTRCETDNQSRYGRSHAHHQQDDEQDGEPHRREKREHADKPGRETHYQPDVSDHAVDERPYFAFGLFSARKPHQQPS